MIREAYQALTAFPRSFLRRVLPPALKAWLKGSEASAKSQHARSHASTEATEATFGYLIDNRRDWLFANLPTASAEYHHDMHGKQQQKRLAMRLGLEVAEEYLANVPLARAIHFIEQADLERFVIKPTASRSSVGCRCVIRDGEGFLELLSGRRYQNLRELERDAAREYAKLERADEWVLEELLMPADGSVSLVEDYKVYCFAGVAELILQKKLIPGEKQYRIQWYTRDWTPVDVGKYSDRVDKTLAAPRNAARLVEVAEAASSKTCYPFLRVDLYDTSRGIIFGEFTPGPGPRRGYNAEWEARLARRWFEAANTLEQGLRSGSIKPLYPEGHMDAGREAGDTAKPRA